MGDHAAVDLIQMGHAGVLRSAGLLVEGEVLQGDLAAPNSTTFEVLVIDDCCVLGKIPVRSSGLAHWEDFVRFDTARGVYEAQRLRGSPHKEIKGSLPSFHARM